uniref:Spatacsin n=1 Tax=Cacopsylla melanoneura TaxID=428564 RepID=A0A8D8SLL9_9HEMI
MVVINAYDCTIDWSLVLYVQVVDKGNRSYLTTWLTNHRLSSSIAQDIASRYQKELKPSPSMTSHMKHLVAQVKPLELKYKLCSQLNFKDILHSIIVNPDVAWLKDTVWQEGYKQKGGLK